MDEFTSGFPPPPFFYKNYSFKDEQDAEPAVCDISDESHSPPLSYTEKDQIERLRDRILGPCSPNPPKDSWVTFGVQEKHAEDPIQLDSETAINLSDKYPDARDQFKVLYREFMESLLAYLSALKTMNPDSVSEIKRFLKLYMNLQHLLSSLSERMAQDDIVRMLRNELERKRQYIDSLKVALVDVHRLLSFTNIPDIHYA